MQLVFTNQAGDQFTLGTVSFNFLNENDVFDEYNEDNSYTSDCIIKVTGNEKIQMLADDVRKCVVINPLIREDIKEKLLDFRSFLWCSYIVEAYIR